MLKTAIGRPVAAVLDRIASVISSLRVPPNVITWSSLFLNLWAGVMFAAGRFFTGACFMAGAGFCDMLDGPVARKQGRVSIFGAFLESILDRYSDLIIFFGIARLLRACKQIPLCRTSRGGDGWIGNGQLCRSAR